MDVFSFPVGNESLFQTVLRGWVWIYRESLWSAEEAAIQY